MKRNPMTARGAEMLRAELKRLKSEDRPNVIKAIAEARSHGDLSENAEYHAAREQQGFIEGRISEIEGKLSTADIIDVTKLTPGGKVVFGATVDLEAEEDGKKVTYTIVGEDEADLVKLGMPVRVFYRERVVAGTVTAVVPSLDQATRRAPVEIEVPVLVPHGDAGRSVHERGLPILR